MNVKDSLKKKVTLFDEYQSRHTRKKDYAEPSFSYLNESGRPELGRIREILDDWYSRYPEDHQPELKSRFRSDGGALQHNYRSAFFELFLHELMLRLGYQILEVHPDVPNNTTKPEFLAQSPAGHKFYIEAVISHEHSQRGAGSKRALDKIFDDLNQKLHSPNFLLEVDIKSYPEVQPSVNNIKGFLKKKLEELDPDEIARRFENDSHEAIPKWRFEDKNGWCIEFSPVPKKKSARGKTNEPLGMFSQTGWSGTDKRVRSSLELKSSRYGKELPHPYLIAVNAFDELIVHQEDFISALYGNETCTVYSHKDGSRKTVWSRKGDGFWGSQDNPRHRHISGVLLANNVVPPSMTGDKLSVFDNPFAITPTPWFMDSISRVSVDEYSVHRTKGELLHEILSLPSELL